MESKGYIAVDFYDGSILYDFSKDLTRICDIDFYRLAPSVNDMGENFWGSRRLKSPEEFMGAIAFELLGGEMDHSFSKWEANRSLYEVAIRAVSMDREQRYKTIYEFKNAWDSGEI